MSNPIDLCSTSDVRLYLSLPLVQGPNPGVVNTNIAADIVAGTRTVTPDAMDSIQIGSVLNIDVGTSSEYVIVTAITSTTFTAMFAMSHTGPVSVTDVNAKDANLEMFLGRLITAASQYILWRTGNLVDGSGVPTQSPFTQVMSFNQWYDGNGSTKLYLRNWPIVSVTALSVNGATIPASTMWGDFGYNIDDTGRYLVFRGSNSSYNWTRASYGPPYSSRYTLSCFARGIQNINVQYTAGFSQVPFDLKDAVVQLIGYNYRRRDWQGMKQVSQPETEGTISYAFDWTTPPPVEEVIRHYSRRAY